MKLIYNKSERSRVRENSEHLGDVRRSSDKKFDKYCRAVENN